MKFVKASLLSLITVSEQTESVVLAYCKETEDEAPPELHWYSQKGKNGKAEYLWQEKKLKQWLVVGSDSEIQNLWSKLINNNVLQYSWKSGTISFTLPQSQKIENSENFVAIKGVTVCGRNQAPEEYECKTWPIDISFLIGEKSNCSFIEGYKQHENIKPLYPPGLLSENSLVKFIERQVCAILIKREIYWHLSGDRTSIVEGSPEKYNGFVQAPATFKTLNRICVRDLEGKKILGVADIDIATGRWSMNLDEPTGKGQFLIQEKSTGNFICGEKYYLIKDVSIQSHIIHTVLTDLFGRKINIHEKEKIEIPQNSILWSSGTAPDSIQSQIELSDKLTDLLLALGEQIIIYDPFFWGDFEEVDGQIKMTTSQKIFLNALITAIARGRITELTIVGYWRRAKNFIKGDKSQLKPKYTKIFDVIKNTFNKSKVFTITRFDLVLSNEPFHDRYWLGDGILFHISNSINGAFESDELKISKEDELAKIKLIPRLNNRLTRGERISLSTP